MKVNSCTIMGPIAKTTGHAFNLLDLGIDAFSQGVGDAMRA